MYRCECVFSYAARYCESASLSLVLLFLIFMHALTHTHATHILSPQSSSHWAPDSLTLSTRNIYIPSAPSQHSSSPSAYLTLHLSPHAPLPSHVVYIPFPLYTHSLLPSTHSLFPPQSPSHRQHTFEPPTHAHSIGSKLQAAAAAAATAGGGRTGRSAPSCVLKYTD